MNSILHQQDQVVHLWRVLLLWFEALAFTLHTISWNIWFLRKRMFCFCLPIIQQLCYQKYPWHHQRRYHLYRSQYKSHQRCWPIPHQCENEERYGQPSFDLPRGFTLYFIGVLTDILDLFLSYLNWLSLGCLSVGLNLLQRTFPIIFIARYSSSITALAI